MAGSVLELASIRPPLQKSFSVDLATFSNSLLSQPIDWQLLSISGIYDFFYAAHPQQTIHHLAFPKVGRWQHAPFLSISCISRPLFPLLLGRTFFFFRYPALHLLLKLAKVFFPFVIILSFPPRLWMPCRSKREPFPETAAPLARRSFSGRKSS